MHIPVNPKKVDMYKAYIMCLNPILKLKPKEVEVLDIVTKTYFHLYAASKKGQVPKKEIYLRMYGEAGRKIMRDMIGMTRTSFNNHIYQLRDKKILGNDLELPKFIIDLEHTKEPLKIHYTIECQKA